MVAVQHVRRAANVVSDEADNVTIHRGSGNFLVDQGVEDPEEFRVKAHLCHEIGSIIEGRYTTQEQAAKVAGLSQADVSRIVNGRFDDYSVWRLIKVLSAFGANVLIAVEPSPESDHGVIMSYTTEPREEHSVSMSP
jgi:predicted XRE-type DNA-binding protein